MACYAYAWTVIASRFNSTVSDSSSWSLCLQVDSATSMAIIIAAQSANINVHANKAIPDSGAGYLALALRTRNYTDHQHLPAGYHHFVPGCPSSGRPFLSVVSVYDDTCVTVDKFGNMTGDPPNRHLFRTMQVHIKHAATVKL